MQERTWSLRWRNPVYCKRLLTKHLDSRKSRRRAKRPPELNLAWIERWSGNFSAAGRLADQATARIDKTLDPEGWTELLVIKAVCAYSLDDHRLADEIVKEGFDVLGSSLDCGVGTDLLVTLATLNLYAGSYDAARDHLHHALRIAEHAKLPFERARILHNLSRAELQAGNIKAALRTGKASIGAAREWRNAVVLPYAYEVYGAALVENGDLQAARDIARKGLIAAKRSADIRVACQLHLVIGDSYLKEQALQKAREAFEQGLQEAESTQYHLWARNFHLHLSRTFEAMGDYGNALEHLKSFTDLQAKLFSLESQLQSNALRSQLDYHLARHTAAFERQLRDKTEKLNRELISANQALRDLNAQIEQNALHDMLTGLGNRRLMSRYFSDAKATLASGHHIAALMIDLDCFKQINDCYGHDTGDKVVTAVARRLSGQVLDDEALIRMGGDEFLLLTVCRTSPRALKHLALDLLHVINEPTRICGQDLAVTASMGVAVSTVGANLEREFLRAADEALYEAKKAGRNQARFARKEGEFPGLDSALG